MTDELKPPPEAVRIALSRVQETDLWSDTVCALVDGAFETVSRNPSDHESAEAFRRAIAAALVIDRALRPVAVPVDVVERPALAANMVEAVERALLMPGVLENPDARQRINAIALAQALTAMQPAIQAAVDALDAVEAAHINPTYGWNITALNKARPLVATALATLRTVTEQGEG